MPQQVDAAASAARSKEGEALTVGAVRRAIAARLRDGGIDTPDLDARILIGYALGLDHAALAAADRDPMDAEAQSAISALVHRRLGGEPVARILGWKEFWSLPLKINAATLVPRPETETIVDAALAVVDAGGSRSRPLRIADLGTGSGALLLALLSELPNAWGVGTDLSARALVVARDNARRLGVARAAFAACDLAQALSTQFDVVVSNPPYIASSDIATLPPEVRDFDPRLALDGGTDGLACYRAIAAAVPTLLAPSGALIVELGLNQAAPVAALFAAAGLAPLPPRPDVRGVPRALVATENAAKGP